MTGTLAEEHPQEYPKGTPALEQVDIDALKDEVPRWLVDADKITRLVKFSDFVESFGFMTKVALLAQQEGHHPDLWLSWDRVEITFWTYTAGGLTRNDFIMAAKVDRLLGDSG